MRLPEMGTAAFLLYKSLTIKVLVLCTSLGKVSFLKCLSV